MVNDNIIFITGNKNKVREFEEILEVNINHKNINLLEIQTTSVKDVVNNKLESAYNKIKKPVIVEDTGLYINEINYFPGALIKFYLRDLTKQGICKYHGNSKASVETIIGYYDGNKKKLFSGITYGIISNEPLGDNGFGWDSIFIPYQMNKTFAEMDKNEKNNCSMRRKALEKFKSFINPIKWYNDKLCNELNEIN